MLIEVSKIKKEVTRNDAEGKAEARKLVVDAETSTFSQIQ